MKTKLVMVVLVTGSLTLATSLKPNTASAPSQPSLDGHGQIETTIIGFSSDRPRVASRTQPPAPGAMAKALRSKAADSDLLAKVNRLIDQFVGDASEGEVRATVENGVVTLEGTIKSAMNKYELEAHIKALSGVAAVNDDRLSATNE